MKRVFAVVAVLASGFTLSAAAQTPTAGTAPVAKVAVIAFQQAVAATNEFQRDFGDLQKKFEPQRSQLKSLSDEVDSLTKQLQASGDKLSDAERASKAKQIDDKKKQIQRTGEDAQNDYQQQMQEIFSRVAQKVDQTLNGYAQQNGYTLVIDESEQQQQAPTVLYAAQNIDITRAIVESYNTKSGVPAPPVPAGGAAPGAAPGAATRPTGRPAAPKAAPAGK